ncbi:hypothetical protein BKA70DRAFT_1119957, partial [Coprinopsis sp. MPI-PUGE-AT-0042]
PFYRACTDPLVHIGRHFGRTVQGFCRIPALLKQGLALAIQLDDEELLEEELPKFQIYKQLLMLLSKLEERLCMGSEEDLYHIASMITKGSANARSDDTRALKSAVVDWITPSGGVLVPPLQRNVKTDRGFHHSTTGRLLCPATLDWSCDKIRNGLRSARLVPTGDQWPLLLYLDHSYNPEDPWNGLLRGPLLVKAFKFVFTSPSSVERTDSHATRCSNSRIHGMIFVTIPSIAYIATQVRFALSSTAVFSRNDFVTDSERFYNSLVTFMQDLEEQVDVRKLIVWWDRQIFPKAESAECPFTMGDSVYTRIKEKQKNDREAQLGRQPSASPPPDGSQSLAHGSI